jgi:xanthine dehydrogenase accessory factor
MKKELELWQFIATRLKKNEKVVLLVVLESIGSSPGRQGFKMVVDTEGYLCGSIGGGIMEIKLVELAKDRLVNFDDNKPKTWIKKQIHNKDAPHNQSGMICSGEQTILFYMLEKTHVKTVQNILSALKKNTPTVLKLTPQYFQLFEHQQLTDDFAFIFVDETAFVYAENLGFKNQLYIIGGGHCALALSELMSKMDFNIHLFDDRTALNTLQKNKFAHHIEVIDYAQIGERIPSGQNVYVVVMTVGYRTDAVVVRQLLDKNLRYLGVLGSTSKRTTLLEMLKNEGFSTDILRGVHTPIGLTINSQTPEEIAVSIAAEVISVKNRLKFNT